DKAWTEQEAKLPPYPKPENLVAFVPPSGSSTNSYFVDGPSIDIGADGVVRYTLLVRSPSGVENVSYEGMRCKTAERKPYAYGHKDGTWSQARAPQWRGIRPRDVNNQYSWLYLDVFCPQGIPVRNRDSAVRAMKSTKRSDTSG